jgi:hypothetical protein
MPGSVNSKPIPRSILIFGASGHIGRPLTEFLHKEAPQIRLRLVSSQPVRIDELRRDFPQAEVVCADYFDGPSLESAVWAMEGVFVNTPPGTDERSAMTNCDLRPSAASCASLRPRGRSTGPGPRPAPGPTASRRPPLPG